MARRRGRLVLGILGGVIGVLVLVVILVPLLIPREHLRSLAEQKVQTATGGEASLGQVSLRILPRLRLVLGESSVAVTAAGLRAAGQDPGPLLSGDVALERLEVDLALWPLLRRQLEFGEVRLISPRLDLVTAPASDLEPEPGAAPAAEPEAAAMDFGLALAAVEVRDGQVHWREDGTGREVLLTGWQQDMAAPELGVLLTRLQRLGGEDLPADALAGPVSLELVSHLEQLDLRGFSEQPLPPLQDLRLRLVLSLPAAAATADFTVQELSLPGWLVTASGQATAERIDVRELALTGGDALEMHGAASLTPPPLQGPLTANLSGTVDLALILAQVEPWLPPLPADAPPLPTLTGNLQVGLEADLTAPPPFDAPEAWATAWEQGLAGRANLTVRGGPVTVAMPQLGEPLRLGGLELVSDLRAANGTTRLVATDLAHPFIQGRAVMEIVPQAGPDQAVQTRLELPRLDLDALAVLVEAMQSQQTAAAHGEPSRWSLVRAAQSLVRAAQASPGTASAPAPGELIPPDLAVDLTATVQEIIFLKSPYTAAKLSGKLRERVIDVTDFSARLGSGQVTGQAKLDYARDPLGHASWDMRVQEAPAGLLLSPYLPLVASLWTGTLSAQAAGSCDLADPQAILNSLNLTGNLQGSNGAIDLRESLAGVRQYLGQRQDLLNVQYSQVRQRFKIDDGKVMVEDFRIDGRDTDWLGGGWLGLDGTLNLDLNVRLPAGFTPDLGNASFLADALRDEDGRIALDFSLTGEARRPTVGLNLNPADMLKSDEIRDKLKDEGKEQLKKLQEELKKKGAGSMLDRIRGGR